MKKILSGIILAWLLLSMFPLQYLMANNQTPIQVARQNGLQFVHERAQAFSDKFKDADLIDGEPCFDLQGNTIGYLFTVVNDLPVGFIIIGNSCYSFKTLEASTGPRPSFPAVEVANDISNQLGIPFKSSTPSILYLGYGRYYAHYDFGEYSLAIDLSTGEGVETKYLSSSLATPEEMRQNILESGSEKTPEGTLTLVYLNVPFQDMADDDIYEEYRNNNNCGPTSASMISEYWRSNRDLSELPTWASDHDELYILQYCNNWFPGYIGTAPWNFGPGLTQFWDDNDYSGFDSDWGVSRNFSVIEDEIDNDRPLGVMFSYNLYYTNWHWCVIKGYLQTDTQP